MRVLIISQYPQNLMLSAVLTLDILFGVKEFLFYCKLNFHFSDDEKC